jgi:hypothetical protein
MNLLTQPTVPDLQPVAETSSAEVSSTAISDDTFFALDDITLAFLDRYATRYVGPIPPGIAFTPVARSFTQFSHMTVVRGEGFEVLVDYATTTMNENRFSRLPDLNITPTNPHCDAEWCRPERRIANVENRTRNRSSQGQGFVTAGLVSATDNIVIYYDEGDQNDMARVRMKLCDRPTSTNQAICEPVTDVILPDGSSAIPVGVVDGIEQFMVPYTYSSTSVHSANFHTADLWIAPPDSR